MSQIPDPMATPMHVLLVHQAFVTRAEAGGTRHVELARYLVDSGHRVTVLTGSVSLLTGGERGPGTGGATAGDAEPGIRVVHCRTHAAVHRSYLHRFLSYVSFMLSSVWNGLSVSEVDLVWGTSPPIHQGLSGWLLARVKRVPFVFEVRDLWPDFAVGMGILRNRALIWMARWVEQFLYRHADRIIVNSPGFLPHMSRCGVVDQRLALIPNGVEVSGFDVSDERRDAWRRMGINGEFLVVYAGAHGPANDLMTVVRAAERLADQKDICFVLMGDGKERAHLIAEAERRELGNIRFLPAQPKEMMAQFLCTADACLAILKPISMFTTTYPNKVFDYMAARRPTILAIDGVIREVIETANGGTFVPPGDAERLADAVLRYYSNPSLGEQQGRSARSYVEKHFDRRLQAPKLEALFEELCQSRR